ncbi:MAG: MupA/Atu3671 family FMN-dependent luciferase-like monooxygenase, partial [Pseudomonadota bacterium]
GAVAADLPARVPGIEHRRVPQAAIGQDGPLPGAALTLVADTFHADLRWISQAEAQFIAARTEHLAAQLSQLDGLTPCSDLPILPGDEREILLTGWNATETGVAEDTCLHSEIEDRVRQTPDAPAVVFPDQTLSFRELDARANQVAHVLLQMGVGPNVPVGLYIRRSTELIVAALGILKAGGAYVPLDPTYPADRIQHCIADSGATVIVAEAALSLDTNATVINIDTDARIGTASTECPQVSTSGADMAYLIYTSGSTGRPKGVMVEHRNVVNFFAGMDARIPLDPESALMAVTSLSFDISVLELFWSLARGVKVVLSDEDKTVAGPSARSHGTGMDFSLYYWGNDDGVGTDKYTMLLEGAKFADKNGFAAVWTPERHFHAFGGLYPNPAVTGAAVAAVTERIGVRAGSCVAPLHHPARIAEEWAVIDNMTAGRAGIAFASGWQPDDFILRPENAPPKNKPALFETLATVRKLWAGEAVAFEKADGTTVECLTQPRPVSQSLNAWVTTAGNPETWRQAGENGCNVLTHLLGQTVDEVGEKIKIYHQALRDAGRDPGDFSVTLLLHTYIAEDRETARDAVRTPMKNYLRSAADLMKQHAWAFPAFQKPEGAESARDIDLGTLDDTEMDAILEFAFDRYFERSGLFGTVADALARVDEVKAVGVTEIACLIDFGLEREKVLTALPSLAQVVAQANVEENAADHSLAASIVRHKVTHLQCTPYMARMLLTNEDSQAALSGLRHMMVGGEPVSPGLVNDLSRATDAQLWNMYGPTETTIWSTVAKLAPGAPVRIGTPIANTQIYILNERMEPCPVGIAGEMFIGGAGVTRGYHNRQDLTAERFVDDPFRPGNRMFRTGDLARWDETGQIEFLGRQDTQVKLRGYRIELGEIEAALEAQPGVQQAVVITRKDRTGVGQLIGYITGDASGGDLRAALAAKLPPFMVPTRVVTRDSFPMTPNKKVDRKALSAPDTRDTEDDTRVPAPKPVAAVQTPQSDVNVGETIAEIWADILKIDRIAPADNFFDLGGHSLLAIEAHRAMRDRLALPQLSIADIFRAPTLAGATELAEGLRTPMKAQTVDSEPVTMQERDATINRRRDMRRSRHTH